MSQWLQAVANTVSDLTAQDLNLRPTATAAIYDQLTTQPTGRLYQ